MTGKNTVLSFHKEKNQWIYLRTRKGITPFLGIHRYSEDGGDIHLYLRGPAQKYPTIAQAFPRRLIEREDVVKPINYKFGTLINDFVGKGGVVLKMSFHPKDKIWRITLKNSPSVSLEMEHEIDPLAQSISFMIFSSFGIHMNYFDTPHQSTFDTVELMDDEQLVTRGFFALEGSSLHNDQTFLATFPDVGATNEKPIKFALSGTVLRSSMQTISDWEKKRVNGHHLVVLFPTRCKRYETFGFILT